MTPGSAVAETEKQAVGVGNAWVNGDWADMAETLLIDRSAEKQALFVPALKRGPGR